MKLTLHKIKTGFIVTSDEEAKTGELGYSSCTNDEGYIIYSVNLVKNHLTEKHSDKVIAQQNQITFSEDIPKEKLLELGVYSYLENLKNSLPDCDPEELDYKKGQIIGFQKAQELLSDRMFTLEDMRRALELKNTFTKDGYTRFVDSDEDIIQSLSKTSWEVEIEMEVGEVFNGLDNQTFSRPKLTPEGKIKILKIKN